MMKTKAPGGRQVVGVYLSSVAADAGEWLTAVDSSRDHISWLTDDIRVRFHLTSALWPSYDVVRYGRILCVTQYDVMIVSASVPLTDDMVDRV